MIIKELGSEGESTDSQSGAFCPDILQEELRRRVSRIRTDHTTGQDNIYPELNTVDGLNKWVMKLEFALKVENIPEVQWPDAAMIFMAGSGRVNMAMRSLRERRSSAGRDRWTWGEFKNELREIIISIENEPSMFQRFRQEHPYATSAAKMVAGAGLVAAGTTLIAPVAVVGTLNGIGFTAAGVAGNSIAAGIQSAFYGGATTGLFSLCQSLGTAAVTTSVSSIVTAAGTIAAGASILRSENKENAKPTQEPPQDPSCDSPLNGTSSQDTPPPYRR